MNAIFRLVVPLVAILPLLSACNSRSDVSEAKQAPQANANVLYVKVKQSVKKGDVLTAAYLEAHEGSPYNTPALAVRSTDEAVGRKASHDLRLGQWLSEQDFEPVAQPQAPLAAYSSRKIAKGEALSRENVIFLFKSANTMMPSGAAIGTGILGLPTTREIPKGKAINFSDLLE